LGPSGSSGSSGPEFLPSQTLAGGFKANGDPLVLNGEESDRGFTEFQKLGYGSGIELPSKFTPDGSEDYKFIPINTEEQHDTNVEAACRIYGYS